MNGSLHLGHGFTISKVEFAAGFERMRGKRVLWPVGFHVTGMPIKSAADKLIREMEMFGPNFENYSPPALDAPEPAAATEKHVSADVSKAKKGKLQAKSTGLTYQFQIMESIGVPREEIKKFAEPNHWVDYFPPIAVKDLNALGSRVDWRRAMVTTPINPYYDAFVRWQMNKLKKLGYIKFGKRYTIYSPKDGQPCMDHDRQSGEGVGPQEYTAIKMPVVEFGERAQRIKDLVGDKKVVMVAATLRPETMYGQTNCFVGPTVKYGLFPSPNKDELYLITLRAARNMAFQGLLAEPDVVPESLGEVLGSEMIGSRLSAPNAVLQTVYVLPMDSVSATKGTAVVTCVPSDSPDDCITSLDLRKKAAFYNIDPSWVPAEFISVLSTPTYGDMTAPALVEKFKIQSPKDAKALADAKEIAYKEGFYNGTMTIGPYKGEKVEDAKIKVREQLIKEGLAFAYSEPENMVMSRSADECVVALCDQWYIDYGEVGWLKRAELLLSRMNCYSTETRHGFERTLGWLRQWACARSYGLGSPLPWDPQYLVESLSDSTIYMSYYTISHLLHGPPIDGSKVGPLGITAEQMTDEVWDYIYANAPFPKDSAVPLEKANQLKAEFSYFYPMDLRSSAKDLIPNHLSFCIYVHAALFAEEHWPTSMRANGHLLLNGEKMSKSTGNSLTLRDALDKFGADATRVTLADAGDSIEDANFEEATANAAILRLRTLIEWCEEVVGDQGALRSGEANLIWDRIFQNELNQAIELTYEAYDKMNFKEALKVGFYNLLGARDAYRDATQHEGGMHKELITKFVEIQALLLTPIASHVAEHLWSGVLGKAGSIQSAQFPVPTAPVDLAIVAQADYVRTTLKSIRDSELAFQKKKAKGKGAAAGAFDPSKPKAVRLFVSSGFPEWQETTIAIVKAAYDPVTAKVDDAKVREQLAAAGLGKDKKAMPFVASFKKRLAQLGPEVAFDRKLLFDEEDTLERTLPYIRRNLGIQAIVAVKAEEAAEGQEGFNGPIVEAAEPGNPGIVFYNTEA